MNLLRHPISAEAMRFVAAGGLNTAVTYGIYLILLLWMRYEFAYALAFTLGVVISYFLNAIFVFRTPPNLKSAFAFPLVYLVQLALGSVLLKILIEALKLPEQVAPLAVIALMMPVTFLLSRCIVGGKRGFRNRESSS